MKIPRINIKNFVQIKQLDLNDLTGTTLITGKNGIGKTTALHAIGFAFGFDVRDARGVTIRLNELIGPHDESMEVKVYASIADRNLLITAGVDAKGRSVEIDDIDRKQPAFLGVKGIAANYAALYELMGVDPKHLECALLPRTYLLGPDLGNILAALCSGDWTMQDVKAAAGEHWAYLGEQFFNNPPCTNLDLVGRKAFELRAEVKKSIKKVEAEIEAIGDVVRPLSRDGKPMDPEQIPVVNDALQDLRSRRDALTMELGRVNSFDPEKRKTLESSRAENTKALDVATKAETKAKDDLKQTQDTLDSASKALDSVKKLHAEAEAVYAEANTRLQRLSASKDECITCGHKMSPEELKAVKAAIEDDIAKAKARLDEINLDDAESKCAVFDQAYIDAATRLQARKDERIETLAVASRIDYELEQLGGTKSMRSTDEIQTEIETVEERIAAGEIKLRELVAWTSKQSLGVKVTEAKKTIEHLDWAVAAFRDGEFLKSRLSGSVNVFEDACNEKLADFGYSLSVVVNGKDCSVLIRDGELQPSPIARCSKGELVLAGYAVATAFGASCPVCVDDIDALYSETKSKFISQLKLRNNEAPIFAVGAWTAGSVDLEPIRNYLTNAKVVWMEKKNDV